MTEDILKVIDEKLKELDPNSDEYWELADERDAIAMDMLVAQALEDKDNES